MHPCRSILILLVLLAGCRGQDAAPEAAPESTARAVAETAAPAPEGMVYVPGGTTQIGAEDGMETERPVFSTDVRPYFMDRHPVTVTAFRQFVEATGHVTQAERFGDAGVLDSTAHAWRLVPGATWHHPLGPAGPAAPDDHPVTQVSWHDAVAFCEARGARLPTEVEWEHAARGAHNDRRRYAWGDTLVESGTYRANTWQGTFPYRNTGDDGFRRTSPVGTFGATPLGLTDMGGNVWEWTADWFRSYADRAEPFSPTPQSEKAQRGGSFLCNPSWCHGYRVSARSHSTPETALFHVGFRCVQDLATDS